MQAQPLAHVIRGETVESIHRGHLVVMDGNKQIVHAVGNPETVTYFRSSAKAFQALPFITSGACDALGYSDEEIALACASHSGEARHVRIAQLMLERAGLTEAYLRCGAHLPFSEKEAERMQREGEHPNQLHNNCSGKHASMLAFAKHIGADTATYDSIDNPVQQEILTTVANFAELPVDQIAIGIDGCSAPNFAMPVSAMARCYANLVNPPATFGDDVKEACRRIMAATLKHPELIGGTERLDTMLMQAAPEKLLSKVGADGVWLCGLLPGEKFPTGLAIALKIEDGDDKRGRPVIATALLKWLGVLSPEDLTELSPMPVRNRRGDVVGRVESRLPYASNDDRVHRTRDRVAPGLSYR